MSISRLFPQYSKKAHIKIFIDGSRIVAKGLYILRYRLAMTTKLEPSLGHCSFIAAILSDQWVQPLDYVILVQSPTKLLDVKVKQALSTKRRWK